MSKRFDNDCILYVSICISLALTRLCLDLLTTVLYGLNNFRTFHVWIICLLVALCDEGFEQFINIRQASYYDGLPTTPTQVVHV